MKKPADKKTEIALLMIATLGIISSVTVVSSLPLISKTFSNIPNIDFLSKLMLSVPSLVIAIFSPFAGRLLDKFGRLKPVYIGIALFVIGGSSGLYLNNFYLILAGRAILGLGVSLIMTATTALIGDYFAPKLRHKFMSKQGTIVAVSGITSISLGGILAQQHWSYPFAIYLVPILFLPFLLKHLHEPKLCKRLGTSEVEPKLFLVYLTAFFVMVLFYMVPTQFPYLVVNKLGGKVQTVGFVIATSMAFNATISMQYAKIKARLSFNTIYAVTFTLFSLGLFIISQASEIWQLFFATMPMGMGFGLLYVNTNAWFLSLVPPQKRGRASGVLTSSFFLGQFASPILLEPIASSYGIQKLFLFVSIFSLTVAFTIGVKSYFSK